MGSAQIARSTEVRAYRQSKLGTALATGMLGRWSRGGSARRITRDTGAAGDTLAGDVREDRIEGARVSIRVAWLGWDARDEPSDAAGGGT